MNGRRLSLHAILVSGASAGGQLVMLLVFAAMGREIGPADLGVVGVAMSVAMVISGLVDFGANGLWVRDLSSRAMSELEYARRSATKILVGLAIGAVMVGVCLLVPSLREYWGAGATLFSWILTQTLHVALRAESKNVALSVSLLAERAGLLGGYFALVWLTPLRPETAFFFAYVLGAAVGAAVALLLMDANKRPRQRPASLRSAWRGARYFGIGSILINLSTLDTTIAAAVGGKLVAGLYTGVNRWTQPIMLASNTFTTLLVPVAARARDMNDVWQRIRSTLWLPAGGAALCLLMALVAEPLVLWIMGPAFADSVPVLRWLAAAVAVVSINQPLAGLLQARGHERRVAAVLMVSVPVRLLLLVPLVHLLGAPGVGLAFFVAELVLLAGLLGYVRRLGVIKRIRPLRESLVERKAFATTGFCPPHKRRAGCGGHPGEDERKGEAEPPILQR